MRDACLTPRTSGTARLRAHQRPRSCGAAEGAGSEVEDTMWTRRRQDRAEILRLSAAWVVGLVALGAVAAAGQRLRTGPPGAAPAQE